MIGIKGIPLIVLGIIDNGVNFLDSLVPNYTTFIYIFFSRKSKLTKNGFTLLTSRKLQIIGLVCTNYPSPKIVSCILSFKLFWIYYFGCGCFTKSLSNICCPTCLTNPSFTSLSIYVHFVIPCCITLQNS
jgi:hypothetical protein